MLTYTPASDSVLATILTTVRPPAKSKREYPESLCILPARIVAKFWRVARRRGILRGSAASSRRFQIPHGASNRGPGDAQAVRAFLQGVAGRPQIGQFPQCFPVQLPRLAAHAPPLRDLGPRMDRRSTAPPPPAQLHHVRMEHLVELSLCHGRNPRHCIPLLSQFVNSLQLAPEFVSS